MSVMSTQLLVDAPVQTTSVMPFVYNNVLMLVVATAPCSSPCLTLDLMAGSGHNIST
jgi:hypothetical protein